MEQRSASQILFGHLPDQTVDVRGGVWRVVEWSQPHVERNVDDETLRRELRRLASPWQTAGRDGGFVQDLFRGVRVKVLSLDRERGIRLEPFPRIWICRSPNCNRLHDAPDSICPCGYGGRKAQMYFVGYCENCGNIREPYIPECQAHGQRKVTFPGTASGSEIRFSCPVCNVELRRGFGFPRCSCGSPFIFNVHRSSSVFTPRSVVIVNPPSHEVMQRVRDAGGGPRALTWVVNGMRERSMLVGRPDRETLRRQLATQGLSPDVIERMLQAAAAGGDLVERGNAPDLVPSILADAEAQAITIALATFESRLEIGNLAEGMAPLSELEVLYRERYPRALEDAGIERVELIDSFPVLTGHYGYTRGTATPGGSRLRAYRDRNGDYIVYGDVVETEALFVRLAPPRVAEWMVARGHNLAVWSDARSAAISILAACADEHAARDLNTLVHSFAHRLIRLTAVHAGIERNALSELLVPFHLGFFIYAAGRGDFVLGGLQAVFEGELHHLLREFVHGEHRCALDPGCTRGGGACVACLHLGEPSCRKFNTELDRGTLTGPHGLL